MTDDMSFCLLTHNYHIYGYIVIRLNPPFGIFLPFQDERELKRERRKQSNRESARRSRLRKQVFLEHYILISCEMSH
jgi:hypothetical protein